MKKLLVLLCIVVFFVGCELTDKPEGRKVVVNYSGDCWLFITNTVDGKTYAYIKESKGGFEVYEEEKEQVIGKWDKLNIGAEKTTGTDYSDTGTLMVSLMDNGNVLISDTALLGDLEAGFEYEF